MAQKFWKDSLGTFRSNFTAVVERLGRGMNVRPWVAEGACAWILGLVAASLVASTGWLGSTERGLLDWRLRSFPRPETASQSIALVLVDQNSILHFEKQLGRWPWRRAAYPPMLEIFRRGGARLIVFDILFSEQSDGAEDQEFAEALAKRRDVILAFQVAHPKDEKKIGGKNEFPTTGPEMSSLQGVPVRKWGPAIPPLEILSRHALGAGHVNLFADPDGPTRRMRLLLRRGEGTHEALPLVTARFYLGRDGKQAPLQTSDKEELLLAGRRVPTADGEFFLRYHGSMRTSFPSIIPAGAVLQAWLDLRSGKKPALDLGVFRDKIILIGATAAGTFDLRATPFSSADPGIFIHATAISNLLKGYFLRPASLLIAGFALLGMSAIGAFVMPAPLRLSLRLAVLVGCAAMFGVVAVVSTVWTGIWLPMATPLFGFAVSGGSGLAFNYLREGRQRALIRQIFNHYMNPDLVELLVREPNRVRLGGERRVLSVFFSDLANFTNLSERLEPEQLVSLLNIYLTEMTEIILRYEGYLDKYEGDAIMAAFGTPIPQTDHACRVCWAALECVERLATLVKELKDESYFDQRGIPPLSLPAHLDWDLSMRIGVNSGPVVAGNMGSLSRMDYTVMGDVVNLASRLEGANKGYGTRIMAGEETIRLAGDGAETRVLDLLRVKGKEKPVWVYEVMARQGGLSPQRLQLRALYEKAHAAYLARRWEEASEGFCEALGVDPTDGPSRTYLERCTIYAKEPPPMDWEGVFVLRTK